MDDAILEAFKTGWYNKEYPTIQAWAEENIVLPASAFAWPGPFSTAKSKYMNDVFAALANPKVRTVSICKSVQSAGSLIGQIYLPWAMLNKKAVMMYLTQGDESAQILAETRIHPILRSIPEFKAVLGRQSKYALKNMTINLDTCNVLIRGAKEKFVQSNSCLVVIGDEVWQWKAGIMDQARARTSKFPDTHKILWISQPSDVDTEWYQEFYKGQIFEWSWECPQCKFVQQYMWDKQREDKTWAGVIWDKVPDERGNTDIFKTAATARLSCYKCKHEIADTPVNRKALMDSSRYVLMNKDGDPSRMSFKWNALATVDQKFAFDPANPAPSLVVQYLQAKEQQKVSNLIPFRNFWQQQLANFWNETDSERMYQVAMSGYDPTLPWADAKFTVMSIDCQASLTEFWVVVRAWAGTGESRLLWYGKLNSFSEIEDKQKEYGIQDQLVFIDSGHETSKVYAECVKHGHLVPLGNGTSQYMCWNATKGAFQKDFSHSEPNSKTLDRRIYAKKQWVDPMLGKKADGKPNYKVPLWVFSTNSIKNILRRYRDGKAGAPFLVPSNDDEYTKQMNSEILKKVKNKKTGVEEWIWVQIRNENHIWDCESLQILSQVLLGNIKP